MNLFSHSVRSVIGITAHRGTNVKSGYRPRQAPVFRRAETYSMTWHEANNPDLMDSSILSLLLRLVANWRSGGGLSVSSPPSAVSFSVSHSSKNILLSKHVSFSCFFFVFFFVFSASMRLEWLGALVKRNGRDSPGLLAGRRWVDGWRKRNGKKWSRGREVLHHDQNGFYHDA